MLTASPKISFKYIPIKLTILIKTLNMKILNKSHVVGEDRGEKTNQRNA